MNSASIAANGMAGAAPELPRPGLAIISNSLAPYRVNLHALIADGIPELKLHSLITHGAGDFVWSIEPPQSINVSHFGRRGDSPLAPTAQTPIYEWRKGGRIIEYIRRNNVRAVMLNSYRYISYLRVIDYCHRTGLPLFVNTDSNLRSERKLSPLPQFLKYRIYRWWMSRAAGFMSMGKLGDQFFLKYGANSRQLYRLPYWPDFDRFARRDEVELQRFHQKFGLSDQRQYILYSGRLLPWKRVDLLIDAFAGIAALRPEWDLLIVGEGVLRDELRRRIPDPLRSRVVWTGFLDGEEAVAAYHAADVLVVSSDREQWALVVQEAMSAGLVVVATETTGAAYELIEDGQSGRLFPAGDRGALEQALLDVTARDRLGELKRRSRLVLDEYRVKVDPVAEMRRAMTDAGVLTQQG